MWIGFVILLRLSSICSLSDGNCVIFEGIVSYTNYKYLQVLGGLT